MVAIPVYSSNIINFNSVSIGIAPCGLNMEYSFLKSGIALGS